MPLDKSKSAKAFSHNVAAERSAGKPLGQSLAIAYSVKRRAKKMARGGDPAVPQSTYQASSTTKVDPRQMAMMAHGGPVPEYDGFETAKERGQITGNYESSSSANHQTKPDLRDHEKDTWMYDAFVPAPRQNGMAMSEDDKRLGQHGADEVFPYADGGTVDSGSQQQPVSTAQSSSDSSSQSSGSQDQSGWHQGQSSLEKFQQGFGKAEGGFIGSHEDPSSDLIERIMAKRDRPDASQHAMEDQSGYQMHKGNDLRMSPEAVSEDDRPRNAFRSRETQMQEHMPRPSNDSYQEMPGQAMVDPPHGGDDQPEGIVDRIMRQRARMYSEGGKVANETEVDSADHMPAQYDDLVLDDDLEQHDTGANSGDGLDDAQENHDRNDIVARIMKSRAKRDRMPNPA